MTRKVHKYNFIWLIIYLWVIGTLPMHHHDQMRHTYDSAQCKHHEKQDVTEVDCIICFNLHVPSALDHIPFLDYSALVFTIYTSYNSANLSFWPYKAVHISSNKDPPHPIYS